MYLHSRQIDLSQQTGASARVLSKVNIRVTYSHTIVIQFCKSHVALRLIHLTVALPVLHNQTMITPAIIFHPSL